MVKIIQYSLVLLSLVLLWQIIVWLGDLPSFILPTPLEVLNSFYLNKAVLFHHTQITLEETLLGLFLGILFGTMAAIFMILFRPLRWWILPLILISQSLPLFAIAPLLVIWFGYGMLSKVVTSLLMIFFPIASNFYDGLKNTPEDYLNLAKTMNAKKIYLLCFVQIPAALPDLASGLRIAATFAPMGAVIGEWIGANEGLGYLILNCNSRMDIELMFCGLICVILMSMALYKSVDLTLIKLIHWQGK
jgi:putative hydroxymethylpyrimidine transport system permease protein